MRVSRTELGRALRIADALLKTVEAHGWTVTTPRPTRVVVETGLTGVSLVGNGPTAPVGASRTSSERSSSRYKSGTPKPKSGSAAGSPTNEQGERNATGVGLKPRKRFGSTICVAQCASVSTNGSTRLTSVSGSMRCDHTSMRLTTPPTSRSGSGGLRATSMTLSASRSSAECRRCRSQPKPTSTTIYQGQPVGGDSSAGWGCSHQEIATGPIGTISAIEDGMPGGVEDE